MCVRHQYDDLVGVQAPSEGGKPLPRPATLNIEASINSCKPDTNINKVIQNR